MSKMTPQIGEIVAAGGGVILDAGSKTRPQLVEIAAEAARSGATVILRNVGNKLTSQLVDIARAGKGKVIFEI
jgi:hypothetical protein